MTKCLSCELFMRHQQALGIFEDENVQQVWRICGIRHFEDSGFYQNHYPCEVDGCDVTCESWSVRSDSGSSTTEASPFAEVVPVLTDDKMGSHPDAQRGSMDEGLRFTYKGVGFARPSLLELVSIFIEGLGSPFHLAWAQATMGTASCWLGARDESLHGLRA